jgi:hypothetical protein
MERAIERSIPWRDSQSTVGSSVFVRRYQKTNGYTWFILRGKHGSCGFRRSLTLRI